MLARSFSSLIAGSRRAKKSSSLTRHATPNDGKYAHLLLTANLEAPSARNVAVSRYLPAYL